MTNIAPAGVAAIAASVLTGCATLGPGSSAADLLAKATPLCTVVANPKAYEGRRILVHGTVTLGPHSRDFRDRGCERGLPVELGPVSASGRRLLSFLDASIDPSAGWEELDDGRWRIGYGRGLALSSLSIRSIDPEGAEHFIHPWGPQRVRVVYSGILIDHSPSIVCLGVGNCSDHVLEQAELLAVRP